MHLFSPPSSATSSPSPSDSPKRRSHELKPNIQGLLDPASTGSSSSSLSRRFMNAMFSELHPSVAPSPAAHDVPGVKESERVSLKVAFYSTTEYDTTSFVEELTAPHRFTFIPHRLDVTSAILAQGHDAICIFVNDRVDKETMKVLKNCGVRFIALRCAGFNNVNLKKAEEYGIQVVRVPAYSPEAVAEFAVGLILTVIRKYHKAYNRVREGNFLLSGLVGFNLHGKTVGIIGTGKIGMLTGRILSRGFNCTVIAHDPYPNEQAAAEAGMTYVSHLDELLSRSDIISLHCPLLPSTRYLLNSKTLPKTKPGVIIVNTSRGALIDTKELIQHLKSGHVGAVGLDVYENEEEYFFRDASGTIIHDDVFSRLLSFYNVFLTGHQAYLTTEALQSIAQTTLDNLNILAEGRECKNVVKAG